MFVLTQAHVHRGTFWPRVECFKFRVPFHLLWSRGWMQVSLKALSTFSIYVLSGDPWVWNCTLKPGAKNHHLILTASVFSQQVLCPSKKCEEKHQPQKMHPQVTFWEASAPKILTETTEIGQLQRCYERLYSFLRNKFHVRLESKFL